MSLEQDVLARVKPTSEEDASIHEIAKALEARVMGTEAAKGHDIQPYLVGSIAKGTHLKDPDADLFLLFDPKVPREELERIGLAIGHEAIEGREYYAEHPYVKGVFMGLKTDIVPAYRIIDSSQKMTAVDRTPFHTEFVKSHLKPELRDDVRLLKAFMKGIGTYGADARTMGFSGYLCELLVIRYSGFHALLRAAASWRSGLRLEIGPATDRKFDGPITFIDPVDPARNVASALSRDNMAMFIAAARDYIENPALEFFFPKPVERLDLARAREIAAQRGDIITVTMPRPDLIDDIMYPQMRKFERNLAQALTSSGFRVMDSETHASQGKLTIIIELEAKDLPPAVLHRGPPVTVRDNSQSFIQKWKASPDAISEPFIKDGCWNVFARRKHASALDYLNTALDSVDAGKDLNKLRPMVKITDTIGDNAESLESLSLYFDRRPSWSR